MNLDFKIQSNLKRLLTVIARFDANGRTKKTAEKRSIAFAVIGAVIAVCICVSVFKVVTDDIDLNHYIKEDSVVEMWVPVSDDTEKSEKQKSIYDEDIKSLPGN